MSEKGAWVKPAKRTTRRLKDLLSEEELSILENNEPVVSVAPVKVTPKKITRASTRKFQDIEIENKFDTVPVKTKRSYNVPQDQGVKKESAVHAPSKHSSSPGSSKKPKGRPTKNKKHVELMKKSNKKKSAGKMADDMDSLSADRSDSWGYVCVASLVLLVLILAFAAYFKK